MLSPTIHVYCEKTAYWKESSLSPIRGERGLKPRERVAREDMEREGEMVAWVTGRGLSLVSLSDDGSVAVGESLEIGENTLPPLESLASRFSTSDGRL